MIWRYVGLLHPKILDNSQQPPKEMAVKVYPNTRTRVEARERTRTFATASEIRSALGTDRPDDLIEG